MTTRRVSASDTMDQLSQLFGQASVKPATLPLRSDTNGNDDIDGLFVPFESSSIEVLLLSDVMDPVPIPRPSSSVTAPSATSSNGLSGLDELSKALMLDNLPSGTVPHSEIVK